MTTGRRKTNKTNLALAILLIAVSSTAYWFEFRKKPQLEKAEEEKTKLLQIDSKDEIESIVLVDKDKKVNIELRCDANCALDNPASSWKMSSPVAYPADAGNVGTFVSGFIMANVLESFKLDSNTEAKLKEFGLSPEVRENHKVSLRFKRFNEPFTIYFGEKSAIGQNYYSLLKGNGADAGLIRIIPVNLFAMVDQDASFWREKRLMYYSAADVESIAFKNSRESFELRKEGQQWYVVPSGGAKKVADNEAVETFVAGLVYTNVESFVSDDKNKDRAKFQLSQRPHYSMTVKATKSPLVAKKTAPPQLTIDAYDVLESKGKEKTPKFYVITSDKNFIAELERGMADRFSKKVMSFRFRGIVTTADMQVTEKVKVAFAHAKEHTLFEKHGGAWKPEAGSKVLEEGLAQLNATRVSEFLTQTEPPKGNALFSEWVLMDKNGKEVRSVRIYGTNAKGSFYAKVGGIAEIMKLEQTSASAIPSHL